MTEFKFTPGPWLIGMEKRGSIYRPCIVADNTKIVSVSRKEDAYLIAAAPEMYEALVEATKRYCGICRQEPVDTIKDGCPVERYKSRAYVTSCVAQKWLKILRKARGESVVSG